MEARALAEADAAGPRERPAEPTADAPEPEPLTYRPEDFHMRATVENVMEGFPKARPFSSPVPSALLNLRCCLWPAPCVDLNETTSSSLLRPPWSALQASVAQSCPTLRPRGPQHARPPCPSPAPGVHPDPCSLSRRCHPAISCSVVPFPSRLQSFPASGSFPMGPVFASGGQRIGVSASVLPVNVQDSFALGLTSSKDSILGLPWCFSVKDSRLPV